ncbi:unnamed protein product, partial [Prorocentrum cordatum]
AAGIVAGLQEALPFQLRRPSRPPLSSYWKPFVDGIQRQEQNYRPLRLRRRRLRRPQRSPSYAQNFSESTTSIKQERKLARRPKHLTEQFDMKQNVLQPVSAPINLSQLLSAKEESELQEVLKFEDGACFGT